MKKIAIATFLVLATANCSTAPDPSTPKDSEFQVVNIDREAVKTILHRSAPDMRRCYSQAIEIGVHPVSGKMVAFFHVSPTGEVTHLKTEKSDVDNLGLEKCVLAVLSQIQFPHSSSGKTTTVRYPFIFKGE